MRIVAYAVPLGCLALGFLLGNLLVPVPVTLSGPPRAADVPRETDLHADVAGPPTEAAADAPEGAGTIAGRVVTPEGRPVEGVVVVAYRDVPHERTWPPGRPEPLAAEGPPDPDRELASVTPDARPTPGSRRLPNTGTRWSRSFGGCGPGWS